MEDNVNGGPTLLKTLNLIIQKAKDSAKSSPNLEGVHSIYIQIVQRFFYSNLLIFFKNSLRLTISDEIGITQDIRQKVEHEFLDLFKNAQENLSEVFDIEKLDEENDDSFSDNYEFSDDEEDGDISIDRGINRAFYNAFRDKIKDIDENVFKLLCLIESEVDMEDCEKALAKFEDEIEELGIDFGFKLNGPSLSFGFGDYDDDDY